jgi:hypothetical protein
VPHQVPAPAARTPLQLAITLFGTRPPFLLLLWFAALLYTQGHFISAPVCCPCLASSPTILCHGCPFAGQCARLEASLPARKAIPTALQINQCTRNEDSRPRNCNDRSSRGACKPRGLSKWYSEPVLPSFVVTCAESGADGELWQDTSPIGYDYPTKVLSPASITLVPIMRSGLGMLDGRQEHPGYHLRLPLTRRISTSNYPAGSSIRSSPWPFPRSAVASASRIL